MNFNLKKITPKIKNYPWKDTLKSLRFLPRTLSFFEKAVVITLLALACLSIGYLWYSSWLAGTKLIPTYGGELREGIVGSTKDLDKNVSRLINAGLTKYDSNKNIVGDLAANWEITDSGKTYIFHLRSGFSSADLANQIAAKNLWTDISIAEPDDQTITFSFKQPFSPFLNVSTQPIFNYGPYQIAKESSEKIDLQARPDYYGGRAYIDKISLLFFNTQDDLAKAVKRGDVQSFTLPADAIQMDDAQKFQVSLPRDLDLFFNMAKKDLSDVNIRKALRDGTSPGKTFNLRLVTSDDAKNLDYVTKLQAKWAAVGVTVAIDVKDNVTLQKTTIPQRDYDLLLYGLDYGEDPDPYPFWHSSQMGANGRNLSNFNNKQADKLLESARQQFDSQKRQADYAQFQAILDNQMPMFVVEHQNFYYQISNNIQGVKTIVGTSEADRFLDVASWFIKTKRVKI